MAVSLVTALKANREFLDLYHPYITTEWRRQYFSYDRMKADYKVLKESKKPNLMRFEKDFLLEIRRVDWFLKSIMQDIQEDLRKLNETRSMLQEQNKVQREQFERTIELTLRNIFDKCKACEQFYQLNHFVICKIAKKFEKLIDITNKSLKDERNEDEPALDFMPWRDYRSNEYFTKEFTLRNRSILLLKSNCIQVYSEFFRQKYPSLAFGELEFMKNKDREHKRTRFVFGFKMGMVLTLLIWVIIGSSLTNNHFNFWERPGLYVYTTIGNLLLFRFLWAADIFVWARYDINYIPILGLSNLRPNLLTVSNSTATLFLLFCISLAVFFETNSSTGTTQSAALSYLCPFLLIVWSVSYEVFEYVFGATNSSYSRGLFSKKVIQRCLTAPFATVHFRDTFAADVLTSFTKVISHSLYAGCWILSGSFLNPYDPENPSDSSHDFGSDYLSCSGPNMLLVVAIAECIPLWIRLMQCIRQIKDSKGQLWPFLPNAIKYAASLVVVLYGATTTKELDASFFTLIVFTSLYKWWWDVVMDWGLFEVLPSLVTHRKLMNRQPGFNSSRRSSFSTSFNQVKQAESNSHILLRPLLMFPSPYIYYACIILDLVLRFLWVVSLVPQQLFGSFVGPQLSFFLGSMEIFRRAMWGALRLEYEHLKHVVKGTPGFREFNRVQKERERRNSVRVKEDDIDTVVPEIEPIHMLRALQTTVQTSRNTLAVVGAGSSISTYVGSSTNDGSSKLSASENKQLFQATTSAAPASSDTSSVVQAFDNSGKDRSANLHSLGFHNVFDLDPAPALTETFEGVMEDIEDREDDDDDDDDLHDISHTDGAMSSGRRPSSTGSKASSVPPASARSLTRQQSGNSPSADVVNKFASSPARSFKMGLTSSSSFRVATVSTPANTANFMSPGASSIKSANGSATVEVEDLEAAIAAAETTALNTWLPHEQLQLPPFYESANIRTESMNDDD